MGRTLRRLFLPALAILAQSCDVNRTEEPEESRVESPILGCWTKFRENGVGCIEWCFDPGGSFYGIDQDTNGAKSPIEHFGTYTVDTHLVATLNRGLFCISGECRIKLGDTLRIPWQRREDSLFIDGLGPDPFVHSSLTRTCRSHWYGVPKPAGWSLD